MSIRIACTTRRELPMWKFLGAALGTIGLATLGACQSAISAERTASATARRGRVPTVDVSFSELEVRGPHLVRWTSRPVHWRHVSHYKPRLRLAAPAPKRFSIGFNIRVDRSFMPDPLIGVVVAHFQKGQTEPYAFEAPTGNGKAPIDAPPTTHNMWLGCTRKGNIKGSVSKAGRTGDVYLQRFSIAHGVSEPSPRIRMTGRSESGRFEIRCARPSQAPPPPKSAAESSFDGDHLIHAWTVNTHRCGVSRGGSKCPLDEYEWRLRGVAERLLAADPGAADLVGLQEVAGSTPCLLWPSNTHGPACLALEFHQATSEPAAGFYSEGNQVGAVVGPGWQVLSHSHWELGAFQKRYLLEVVLRHKKTGMRLRFYSTHHSNTAMGKRKTQADKLTKKVLERALPGELPPIVVGDFNAARDFATGLAEPAVQQMEKHFWRAFDATDPSGSTPIDLVYVGKQSSFPKAGGAIVPVRKLYVRLADAPPLTIGDRKDFPHQLTDHDAQGFVLGWTPNESDAGGGSGPCTDGDRECKGSRTERYCVNRKWREIPCDPKWKCAVDRCVPPANGDPP